MSRGPLIRRSESISAYGIGFLLGLFYAALIYIAVHFHFPTRIDH